MCKTMAKEWHQKCNIINLSLGKIGQEFGTFDNAKGQNKKGLGLGLTICKKIIEILGIFNKYFYILGPLANYCITS